MAVGGPDAFLTSAAAAATKQQYPRIALQEQQPQQNYDFSNYLSPESSYRGDPSSPSDFGALRIPDNILMRRPSQEFSQQQDLPSLKLGPRQFGYKPNDIRFYLPAEDFPPAAALPLPQQQEEQEVVFPSKSGGHPPPPPQRAPLPQPQIPHPQNSQQGQHEFVLGDDKSDFYFMKKKELQQQQSPPSPFRSNFPAGPSHIMASDHSANYPGFISQSQIPQEKTFTYSDMYYIGRSTQKTNIYIHFLKNRQTNIIIQMFVVCSHCCRVQCSWPCGYYCSRDLLLQVTSFRKLHFNLNN